MKTTYEYSDIFQTITDDPDHVTVQIPEEICKQLGWNSGDTITVSVEGESIIIARLTKGETDDQT
jgi:antitoxin component of MazEF toxin-antitoxin module